MQLNARLLFQSESSHALYEDAYAEYYALIEELVVLFSGISIFFQYSSRICLIYSVKFLFLIQYINIHIVEKSYTTKRHKHSAAVDII